MASHNTLFNIALTSMVSVIWGSTYLVTTEFLPPDMPITAAMLRALPAGLILLAINRQFPRGKWWFRAILLGTLNIGLFFYLLFVAAYLLPGGVAAMVMSVQPVIILVYSVLLFKNPLTLTHGLACLLAIISVGMVVLKPDAALNTTGILAGLAGAFSMATGIVLTKHWGRPANVSLLTFTSWQLTAGGILLLPVAFLQEGMPAELTWRNGFGFIYLSLIGALLSYALWFRGIEKLPVLSVSFISLLSPLTATLLGLILLGQYLNGLQIIGSIGIITAIILAQPNIGQIIKRRWQHQKKIS